MKKTMQTLGALVCTLGLMGVLHNCTTKEVASLTPFTYTFKGLEDVKLPEVKPTAPAAVTVTPATITVAPQAAAVSSGLQAIASTGVVPEAVKKAADDVAKAVPEEKAAALAASFTPEVIDKLTTSGTLPANLKADVAAVASNAAIKAYLPTYTLPAVSGVAVGGRLGSAEATTTTALAPAANGPDACKKAAQDAFLSVVAQLNDRKQAQTSAVNAAYANAESAANTEVASCKEGVPAKYSKMIADAKKEFDANMAGLEASKATLGARTYNMLRALNLVAYSQLISAYSTLQSAETNLCNAIKDAKIKAAQNARNGDLGAINSNHEAAMKVVQAARDRAISSCHNQGNGG